MTRTLSLLLGILLFGAQAHAVPTEVGGADYAEECDAAGVPIPPGWASGLWTFEGTLPDSFISRRSVGEVYSYRGFDPEGVCIALPRFGRDDNGNATDTISLLGIICQGKATGNACFWDNFRSDIGRFTVQRFQQVPLFATESGEISFGGGVDLTGPGSDVCTNCHAGENAFIVHPGSDLQLGDALMRPDRFMTPIVPDAWPDNPGPGRILESVPLGPGDASCLSCHGEGGHRFPAVSTEIAGYCSEIRRAVGRHAESCSDTSPPPGGPDGCILNTMPPGSGSEPATTLLPGGDVAPFAKHVDALLAACMEAVPNAKPPISAAEILIAIWD